MPTVLGVTVAALGLGSVAAVASITAQQGSVRDYDTKQAFAGAEAGAERALYRYNQVLTTEDPTCVVPGTGGVLVEQPPPADGWCAPVTGTVGSSSYTYRVKPTIVGSENQLDIVSTGTSDTVNRRIEITARSLTGRVFGQFTVIAEDGITLNNLSTINGSAATNGDIFLNTESEICGDAQFGVGHNLYVSGNGHQCTGYGNGPGEVDLPPVDQGDVTTNNSNARLLPGGGDTRTGGDRVVWDPTTRTLTLNADSSLTLGGSNYSMCRLVMHNNTELIVATGASVRVYFDAPENCPGLPVSDGRQVQMDLNAASRITVTEGGASQAAFLFVGSETVPTLARLNSNTSLCNKLIFYAPLTDLEMNNQTTVCGGVAARRLTMNANSRIISDPSASDFVLPIPLNFKPTRFVECTGVADSPPDANC